MYVYVYDVYGLRSTYGTYEAQTVANQSSTSLEVTTVETLNMEANHHLNYNLLPEFISSTFQW